MTSPEWWAKAHATPGELVKPPGTSSDVQFVQTLGTLTYKSHTAVASQFVIPGVGYDLRITLDGELKETQLYRGTLSGIETVKAAYRRDALMAKGWW